MSYSCGCSLQRIYIHLHIGILRDKNGIKTTVLSEFYVISEEQKIAPPFPPTDHFSVKQITKPNKNIVFV